MNDVSEDHRVRVAHARRDRMAKRLLAAVKETYATRSREGIPTVEEVVALADVSRATFYKYFNSVEEAVGVVAAEMVADMVRSLIELHGGKRPAIFLLTSSIHLFLLRAVIEPSWAAFVARSEAVQSENRLFEGLSAHLMAARDAGEIVFDDLDAARALVLGAMIEGIRQIARQERPSRRFVEDVTIMIYVALGLDRPTARQTIERVSAFMRDIAPGVLPWWREPW